MSVRLRAIFLAWLQLVFLVYGSRGIWQSLTMLRKVLGKLGIGVARVLLDR